MIGWAWHDWPLLCGQRWHHASIGTGAWIRLFGFGLYIRRRSNACILLAGLLGEVLVAAGDAVDRSYETGFIGEVYGCFEFLALWPLWTLGVGLKGYAPRQARPRRIRTLWRLVEQIEGKPARRG